MTIRGLTDHADARDRSEVRRHQRIAVANRGGWDELPRKHLAFGPFTVVTDERNGDTYTINRGEIDVDSAAIAAYFITEHGDAVFVEKRAKR